MYIYVSCHAVLQMFEWIISNKTMVFLAVKYANTWIKCINIVHKID